MQQAEHPLIYFLIIESCNGLFLQSLKFSGVIREEKSAETIFTPWDITAEIWDIDEIKSLGSSCYQPDYTVRLLLLLLRLFNLKKKKKEN